jgi:putative ABC transport system ATP-binding protein
MDREVILELSDVSFTYPNGHLVLQEITLSIERGSFLHLQGPSGSGKSTFLRILNRLEEPDEGTITFKGSPIQSYPPSSLRRSVAYIQQTPTLLKDTVHANLLLPFRLKINRHLDVPDDAKLCSLLNEFLLTGVQLTDQAMSLSGGQRQRLCLLRSILLSPEILMLDEPTSALDLESRQAVDRVIETLNLEHHLTILLVSHLEFESERVNPTVVEFKNGRILQGERP